MECRQYGKSERMHEYVLTDKGRDLRPVLVALTGWGDRWLAPDGPPTLYTHADCGGDAVLMTRCAKCDEADISLGIVTRPGPGRDGRERAGVSQTSGHSRP